ncbi:MAG TPA: hypothetical protein VEC14_10450 [Reyranellaceae bacterium]|nr:hypothetical protein [Reyranellaceae bacterium]
MFAHLARLWRRAGPAQPVPVPAKVAIVPANTMPSVDRRLARVKRLRELLELWPAKVARIERKQGAAAALAMVRKQRRMEGELEMHLVSLKADFAGL